MGWRVAFVAMMSLACGGRSSLDSNDLPDTGDTGVAVASVSPTTVDFGFVDCGNVGTAKVVTVANAGTESFSFTAALSGGATSPYVISPANDIVAPGGTVQIVLWPSPIPQASDVSPNFYADTLTVQTTIAGDAPHVIPITETARGAVLSWDATIAFGKRLVGSQAVLPLTITNDGDVDAEVAITTSAPFATTAPSVNVPAKSKKSVDLTYVPEAAELATPVSDHVTLSTSSVLCGPLPSAVNVSGTAWESATAISSGAYTTCAIGQSGNVYCWGQGPLGNGTSWSSAIPVPATTSGVISVAGGESTTCVAKSSGSAECWSASTYGLGNGSSNASTSPVSVYGLADVKRVVGGEASPAMCAIRQTGAMSCWGYSGYGQFGAGYVGSVEYLPIVAFGGINDIVDATLWQQAACVVRSAGGVQCAGIQGMLGDGSGFSGYPSYNAVDVVGIDSAIGVSGMQTGGCAVLSSGDVKCWGLGYNGELGNGTNGFNDVALTPVSVSNLHDAIALAGGTEATCALRSNGMIACWGYNFSGVLGNGTTTSSNVPVDVVGITSAIAVAQGYEHACALLSSGGVRCWGKGLYGQLGDGSTADALTPVSVTGFN